MTQLYTTLGPKTADDLGTGLGRDRVLLLEDKAVFLHLVQGLQRDDGLVEGCMGHGLVNQDAQRLLCNRAHPQASCGQRIACPGHHVG